MFEDKISAMTESVTECHAFNTYQKRTYTVEEIQCILDIGRNSAYNLVKLNVFHSVRVGGNIRISKKSFDEWLDAMEV